MIHIDEVLGYMYLQFRVILAFQGFSHNRFQRGDDLVDVTPTLLDHRDTHVSDTEILFLDVLVQTSGDHDILFEKLG
jgi:hypothetical protein